MPLWQEGRGWGNDKKKKREKRRTRQQRGCWVQMTASVCVCVPLCDVWDAQTTQREWTQHACVTGEGQELGLVPLLWGQYNCTCIMNPTNVTGYVTEKKIKLNGTICYLFCLYIAFIYWFVISSKPKQQKVISAPAANHLTGAEEQTGGPAGGRRGQMVIGQLEGSEQAAGRT